MNRRRLVSITSLCIFTIVSTLPAQWIEANGAGGAGGAVHALAVRDSTIWVGTQDGGVLRSIDNGSHWMKTITGLTSLNVRAFVCTANAVFVAMASSGVFRSIDNGTTWNAVNTGLANLSIEALAVKDSMLFAGLLGKGVFRSSDNGEHWIAANAGLENARVLSFAVSGSNLFAGVNGPSDYGLYRSTDNGATWTGIRKEWAYGLCADSSTVYVSEYNGFIRSTDAGVTWIGPDTTLRPPSPDIHLLVREITTRNGIVIAGFEGNGGIFKSVDKGATWTSITGKYPANNLNSLAISNTHVIAGTEAGVFLTPINAINGKEWKQAATGITSKYIYALIKRGPYLFAGVSGTGNIFRSETQGRDWQQVITGMPVQSISRLAVMGSVLYAATEEGICKSTDDGQTWALSNSGIMDYYGSGHYSWGGLAVSGTALFAGTHPHGVFRSTDNGATWSQCNNGLKDTSITALGVNGTTIWAGVQSGVYRSNDNGDHWELLAQASNFGARSFAFNGSTIFVGTVNGLYRSPNNGANWEMIPRDWAKTSIQSLLYERGLLFAGSYGNGVFVSADNGVSWNGYNSGLMNQNITAMIISDGELIVGTDHVGVWRRPLSEVVTAVEQRTPPLPASCTLAQIYPNPFNPSTNILFELPAASHVTITIFTIHGQRVRTLTDDEYAAGRHHLHWNGRDDGGSVVAAGMYFIRIHAGNFVTVRKAMLVK